jgi:hypothetical protein
MDSDHDKMPLLGSNKAPAALVEDSGDDTRSFEGHASLRNIAAHTVTHQGTPFERKAALINEYVDGIPGKLMLTS